MLDSLRAKVRVRTRLRAEWMRRKSLPLLQGYPGNKLHVGAGSNLLEGWLNTDLHPWAGVPGLDIRRPLPFPNERFRFVFSEHVIEHVTYEQARAFFRECRRVLEPGGVVRTATPDLRRIAGLAGDDWYIADSFERHPKVIGPLAGFVINNFMRDWGHQFVYDRATLTQVLREAGFDNVQECLVGESPHPELVGVEGHWRVIGRESNDFETFVLEAVKPTR